MSEDTRKQKIIQVLLCLICIIFFAASDSLGPVLYNIEGGFDWRHLVTVVVFSSFYAGLVVCLLTLLYKFSYAFMIILTVIYALFNYMNLLHFRILGTYLPINMLGEVQQLNGLSRSILGAMKWYDIAFPLVVTLFLVSYKKLKSNLNDFSLKYHVITISIYMLILFIPINILFKYRGANKVSEWKNNLEWACIISPANTYVGLGLFPIISYQLFNKSDYISLSYTENQEILDLIENVKIHNQEINSHLTQKKRNLVVMLMESLNTACVSPEFMPILDSLCKDSSTLYCPQNKQLTQGAMSIGGQLVVLTGLHGLTNMPFVSTYPDNLYPSIAKNMKDKYHNLYSYIVVSTEANFWRQEEVSRSLGFDNIFDINDMTFRNLNGWADDKEVFELAASKLPKDGTPFISLIVPSNMHAQYIKDENIKLQVSFSGIDDERLHEYMRRAKYLDMQIGYFIRELKRQGLYDDTLIVVTSDHQVPWQYCSSQQKAKLSSYIPVAYINTGIDFSEHNVINKDVVFCHSQVYPTMLEIMGISSEGYAGLFPSMTNVDATIEYDFENSSYSTTKNENLLRAYDIGEKIIRSGYFGIAK